MFEGHYHKFKSRGQKPPPVLLRQDARSLQSPQGKRTIHLLRATTSGKSAYNTLTVPRRSPTTPLEVTIAGTAPTPVLGNH